MKYNEFIKLIAEGEGKKVQVSVGNIREVVSVIVGLIVKHPVKVIGLLLSLAAKKAK